jgi:hypothetical protein
MPHFTLTEIGRQRWEMGLFTMQHRPFFSSYQQYMYCIKYCKKKDGNKWGSSSLKGNGPHSLKWIKTNVYPYDPLENHFCHKHKMVKKKKSKNQESTQNKQNKHNIK